jgi:4-hydroxythreonine-4-phosphate dehydrogenase
MNPIIGITMGDPAGVGPEVVIKALTDPTLPNTFSPVVIGNHKSLMKTAKILGVDIKLDRFRRFEEIGFSKHAVSVLDTCVSPLYYEMGKTNQSCGEHSFMYVTEAVQLCMKKQVAAMVTAPICKESWHMAGHVFDGHTGLLAHLTKTDTGRMMFATELFHVILVTTHLPLKNVSSQLSISTILQTVELGDRELKVLGIKNPRIAVCGLNPHAGEGGIFGTEDIDCIVPAIQQAQYSGIDASGPYSADTIFLRAFKGEFDLVVAQYHDQGLIPVKLLAFDSAVNITIGLPITRTSVDHGTAFDIAGKGIANHKNMLSAIEYACRLCNR